MKIKKNYCYIVLVLFITVSINEGVLAQNKIKTEDVNVLMFKKSSNDDREMIQKAVDYAAANKIRVVFIPDGNYEIEATNPRGIVLGDNIHLKLGDKAILKALPTKSTNYSILRVHNAENVTVSGGKILGERNEHIGTTGEWGHGVVIRDAMNVELRDISINDCWGDGIYIAGTSKDILVSNVICDNNRRQGMSVIAVNGLIVKGSTFKNTNGTAPMAGIDLEPNNPNELVTNVLIESCKFINNERKGLHMFGLFGPVNKVKVINCIMDNNSIGVSLWYDGITQIELSNIKISNSKKQGVRIIQGSEDIQMSEISITESAENAIYISEAKNVDLSNISVKNYSEGILIEKSDEIKLKTINLKSDTVPASNIDISHSSKVIMIDVEVN